MPSDEAEKIFAGFDIQITSHGHKHLGAAIKTHAFSVECVSQKVQQRVNVAEMFVKPEKVM